MTDSKTAATRERVQHTALGLFMKSGLRAVRMDDVAHECGISKRTLYELFKDREQLILECLMMHSRNEDEFNANLKEGSDNVLHAFWLVFSHNIERRNRVSAIIPELQRYYPDIFQHLAIYVHENMVAHTRQELQTGVEQGLIMPSLDLDFFSRALTNYIYGLGLIEQNVARTGVELTSHTIPSAIAIFLRGISTEKGREYIDNKILNIE